jgi:hypothetical protein
MRRHITAAALVACIGAAVATARADEMPKDASIVQLLATPERFDGKPVRVFGFLRLAFEGDALYLHREDDTQGLTRNALWVDRTEAMEREQAKLNAHYVLIEATFDAEDTGHMGLFGGALKKVTRIIPWPPPALK